MKHIFVINPAAGKGDAQESLSEKIAAAAEKCGAEFEIYYSSAVGDAFSAVRKYCEESNGEQLCFYACGGDGTVNEVAGGTFGFENASFGVVPVGTGNDFVKNFGDAECFLDIENQLLGEKVVINGLRVGDRYSVNMTNMGFDCSVVERVAKIKRCPLISAGFAYIAGVIVELARLPGVKVKSLILDGKEVEENSLLLCAFANGSFYGGGFHSAPKAKVNDGLMDVFYAGKVTRLQFISMVGSYKKGTYLDSKRIMKFISYSKCKKAVINFEKEQNICIDGEIHKMGSIEISIIPGCFSFILPKGGKYDAVEIKDEDTCLV